MRADRAPSRGVDPARDVIRPIPRPYGRIRGQKHETGPELSALDRHAKRRVAIPGLESLDISTSPGSRR